MKATCGLDLLATLTLALVVTASLAPHRALAQPAPGSSQPAAPGGNRLMPSELEELLGSIALYPDPLLGQRACGIGVS
jgi:hypothetical protein